MVVFSAFGQAQTAEHSVSGTVRNTLTGEPVRNALVVLQGMPGTNQPNGGLRRRSEEARTNAMLSGPGGEFHFDALPEGRYTCQVQKPGFTQDENPGSTEVFVIPRSPADAAVQVNLTPLGAIEGKVVNQYGEPLERVAIAVYALAFIDGERSARNVGTVWTDDRGIFHLAYLEPGKYYVKATGRRGGTYTYVGAGTVRYAPWEAFSPVYFGGATDIGSAVPIPVAAGARVRTDFHLEVQPAFRIRGTVEGYSPGETVGFELLRGDEQAEPSRALLDGTTGRFEILDVTPGAYKLRAEQEKTRGEVIVNVASADVSGISIALLPAVTVKVSVRNKGAGADPSKDPGRRAPGTCRVTLQQRWHSGPFYIPRPSGSEQFDIEDVFPGEYLVGIRCYAAYPLSASFGAANLLTDPAITLSPGTAPPPIEIEFKPGGGSLKVRFADRVPPRWAVLLVPASSATAGPVLRPGSGGYGAAQTGADYFTLPYLAPGDYSVYGLSQFEDAEFRSPAFLQSLSGGTGVHIEDGKTAEITIMSISK